MNDNNGYSVFFFPQALEALGDAIKPYLQDGAAGPHVLCNGIDAGGALIEMTLQGITHGGRQVALELMVPSGMVRMIASAHSDEIFGFGPHAFERAIPQLPPVGPTGTPSDAPPAALPQSAPDEAPAAATGTVAPAGDGK